MVTWWTGWEAIAKRRWFLNGQVPPLSPPPAPAQDVARLILGGAWWAWFTFNSITRCERGSYALVGGEELSDAERDQLLALCRQRLNAFHGLRAQNVTDRVRNREVA